MILPREHGAWGLLLQPLVCALILGKRWDWLYLPALCLVLTAFIMREPLVILARQRWIWREAKAESKIARRSLAWQIPVTATLFLLCLSLLPPEPVLAIAAAAVAVTALAVWMTLNNKQRSVGLQIVSSMGLGTTALLGALISVREVPAWSWWLWVLLVLHGIASILVVHARLELRAGSRARAAAAALRRAWLFQAVLAIAAVGLLFSGMRLMAAPIAFSALVSGIELLRLRSPRNLSEKLTHVGFRALGASLAHSALTVAVLW
jgi:hypothetical protein